MLIFLLLLPAVFIYGVMIFITIPEVTRLAPELQIPDLMPGGYATEYVGSFLDKIWDAGRYAYLYHQLPLDFIYPGLLTIILLLSIHKIYGRLWLRSTLINLLAVPAFIGGVSDYLENIGLISLLLHYPSRFPDLIYWMNVATITKSTFSTISFITVIVGLVWIGIRWFQKKYA